MKYLIIFFMLIFLFVLFVVGFILIKPQLHSSKGKTIVAMTGRSTMELWFKHWNWPYPLRIKTTYRNWPIRYDVYSHGNLYLEYHPLPGPVTKDPNKHFGQDMLEEFKSVLSSGEYDIAFFKFCFVDFRVDEHGIEDRFTQLTDTVKKAVAIANEKKVKMILGNALPLTNSNNATIELQLKFNKWIADFAKSKQDVISFDLFGPLVDSDNRLIEKLSRGDGDPHLGDKAFSILDNSFFEIASQ